MSKYESAEYQRKVGELVNREVQVCLSALIYELTHKDVIDEEQIAEFWQAEPDIDDKRECVTNSGYEIKSVRCDWRQFGLSWVWGNPDSDSDDSGPYDTEIETLNACIDSEQLDLENYVGEVYEHWAVSKWFADKLTAQGATVREFADLNIWLRQCTGQAILLDSQVCRIYDELHAG